MQIINQELINPFDGKFYTPLMLVFSYDITNIDKPSLFIKMVKIFIKNGAKIHKKTQDGRTALSDAFELIKMCDAYDHHFDNEKKMYESIVNVLLNHHTLYITHKQTLNKQSNFFDCNIKYN